MTDGSYTFIEMCHVRKAMNVTLQRRHALHKAVDEYLRYTSNQMTVRWDWLHGHITNLPGCDNRETEQSLRDTLFVAKALQRGENPIVGDDFIVPRMGGPCERCGCPDILIGFSHKGQRVGQCPKCKKWHVRKVPAQPAPIHTARSVGFLTRLRCAITAFIEAKNVP